MKRFDCQCCHSEVFFDSDTCVSCNRKLGYHPVDGEIIALDATAAGWVVPDKNQPSVVLCQNSEWGACNWIVTDRVGQDPAFCRACRHNILVPDLTSIDNLGRWKKIELAKRHLFYSLLRWRLPIPDRSVDKDKGLGFSFLADMTDEGGSIKKVVTGHADGLITLNIAEADDAMRERARSEMHEPYRTLLGHFRHEVGHFYWNLLVENSPHSDEWRALFGDESIDYADALQRYYQNGPADDWAEHFISQYASSHPWEDFAETWAHYTHVVDSLETARAYGLVVHDPGASDSDGPLVTFDPYRVATIDAIVQAWMPLTVALNSINRSMGQKDFYPFVMNVSVIEKLAFVQKLIRNAKLR